MSTKAKSRPATATGNGRKRASPVRKNCINCFKCKSTVDKQDTLQCSVCKNRYEFACAGLPEKLYTLMSSDSKKNWECRLCTVKKTSKNKIPNQVELKKSNARDVSKSPSSTTSLIAYNTENEILTFPTPDNITIRKKYTVNIPTNNSFESLSGSEDMDMEYSSLPSSSPQKKLNRSCPEIAESLHLRLESMEEELTALRGKLIVSEREIENLNLENNKLKKTINECTIKINKLTHICESNPKNSPRIKRTSRNHTQISSMPNSPSQNTSNYRDICSRNITELSSAIKEKRISSISNLHSHNETTLCANTLKQPEVKKRNFTEKKVCLISSNKRNSILRAAQYNLGEKYQVCHFLTPGVGVKRLLENIDKKLTNYTTEDYCIIFIGENDFKESQNYSHLVKNIREVIEKVKHTNVILCLPTFNCGKYSSMFNWRIELFNKLLYRDIVKYEYAYILDSNQNLTYDYKMFYKWSGCINNYGMKTIFQGITEMLEQIHIENEPTVASLSTENNPSKPEEFFRE